jgi:acyl-CoA reductase-like NAD-dependent aldehyde dehydrogenase
MTNRHEKMRIAGKLVDGDTGKNIDVLNPYNGEVVGTVPRASRAQIAGAFEIAANYKPKLTRYERQKILMRIAEIITDRKHELSDLITAECGLSKKDSLYESGRAFDVYSLAGQQCINDDSEVFSCDLTPHGKQRKIFTQRDPLLGAISAITPFNHPLNMDFAQDRAFDRNQQLHGRQADRADPVDRAGAGGYLLRSRTAAGNAVGGHRPARRHG